MLKPSITFVVYVRGQFLRRQTLARGVIRIGRHPGSHLSLDDTQVAMRHAVIEVDPDRVTLVGLTLERVRVNGQLVDEAWLSVGDRIQLGTTEIVVEEITAAAAAEPELRPAPERPNAAHWLAAVPKEELPAFTYTLLASGPKLRSEEVELSHVLAVEVSISWGENVLSVAHLDAQQSYFVGDSSGADAACDFLIPREKLGASRLPLVLGGTSGFRLVVPANAQGHVMASDGAHYSLAAIRAVARNCDAIEGARELPLTLGTRAELRFGDIVVRVAAVPAGKRVGHGLLSGLDTGALPY
ncbi:MAG TPA: FHA domain-containing protein, partial [Polyangiaceae bacterium]|nr:FHA domain-containing protein [Polyangiaceae bacterium]